MISDLWDRATPPPAAALAIVKFEGDVLHPYQDSRGIWTEGAGDTHLPNGQPITGHSPPISMATSLAWLALDEREYGPAISRFVPVPLTIVQVVPLYSFVHNFGTGRLNGSMIARMLVGGAPALAADQLPGWCLAAGKIEPGLLKRRWAERLLMLGATLDAAYADAWAMSLAQLMAAYHKAFADAAAWATPASPPALMGRSTMPRTAIVQTAEAFPPPQSAADALDLQFDTGA